MEKNKKSPQGSPEGKTPRLGVRVGEEQIFCSSIYAAMNWQRKLKKAGVPAPAISLFIEGVKKGIPRTGIPVFHLSIELTGEEFKIKGARSAFNFRKRLTGAGVDPASVKIKFKEFVAK